MASSPFALALSVILCTHRPRADDLATVLAALHRQTLPFDRWEFLLVDNASPVPLSRELAQQAHPHGRLVREEQLGLTRARLRGMVESGGGLLLFCDDDNLLDENYLAAALAFFADHPEVGVAGGRSLPRFASAPPNWIGNFAGLLALREGTNERCLASWRGGPPFYPACAPIGAGMVLRREVAETYLAQAPTGLLTPDRTGSHLGSGGDCEIVLAALAGGWMAAYEPTLKLTHLIPASRLGPRYLARINRASSRSWVRLLRRHGISPWDPIARWTLPVRKLRSFCALRAWRGGEPFVRWAGACGHLEGQVGAAASQPVRWSAGRLLYLLYHAPRAQVRRSLREGGLWNQWRDARGHAAMRRAAWSLPPLPDFSGPPLEVHLLTGRAYAHQALLCCWSLSRASGRAVAPIFYDDGTFTLRLIGQLHQVFPMARVVMHAEAAVRVDRLLPAAAFPTLRDRFLRYPHIRKLINVHLGGKGWKLILDSDLLFFREPVQLLRWLEEPMRPLVMRDIADAYGYSPALLREVAGGALPIQINAGLCGLRSEALDWEKIECWCARLIAAEGTNYLLEQALLALLLAGQEHEILPGADYLTCPSWEEACKPRAVMHHYVAESKRGYFRRAWREVRGREADRLSSSRQGARESAPRSTPPPSATDRH